MRSVGALIIELVGLGLFVWGCFVLSLWVGLAVSGLALFAVGAAMERSGLVSADS